MMAWKSDEKSIVDRLVSKQRQFRTVLYVDIIDIVPV